MIFQKIITILRKEKIIFFVRKRGREKYIFEKYKPLNEG